MNEELDEYEYVLKRKDQGWVLLKSPDLLGGYCVFNKLDCTLLLVESEEVNAITCDRMLKIGFDVLENIPILNSIVEVERQ